MKPSEIIKKLPSVNLPDSGTMNLLSYLKINKIIDYLDEQYEKEKSIVKKEPVSERNSLIDECLHDIDQLHQENNYNPCWGVPVLYIKMLINSKKK